MAWMNTLYQTYEANAQMAGRQGDGVPLSLVAHMTANAQIEVTVNLAGDFRGACELRKEDGKTIIPVTESSASRSSGVAPHPLCDNLSYVAGDFGQYLTDPKAAAKSAAKFEAYLSALKAWAESPSCTHPKVRAIYAYLSRRQLAADLIASGVLEAPGGKFAEKKVAGSVYEKALVRFRVLDSQPDAVWQDPSLFDCYTRYYLSSQSGPTDICYLTGERSAVSSNHPKGIVAANYGAKLLSANDSANFTYRGRFVTPGQACAVGYEASQKAHSALTWLAARQGVTVGSQDKRTYVCWNPSGKPVVNLANPFALEEDDEPRAYTEPEYKKRLIKALEGYRNQLDAADRIVVIGLDAATTGRLSVTYYNDLQGSDFYDRLTDWGKTCRWYFRKFSGEKKLIFPILPPLTRQIVLCAFGSEQGEFLAVNDKIMKEQSQRVLHCMLDRQPVPRDLMHALVLRASAPQAFSPGNRERILSTACALISKYHHDRGVNISMALDYETSDRSYLFGRLLAVLEKAERASLANGETRETNAIRLQNAYVNHPMSTWKILEEKLNPYFQRMKPGSRKFYRDLISEIAAKLSSDSEDLNRPLGELYLIGYYLQRAELNQPKNQKENNREEEV